MQKKYTPSEYAVMYGGHDLEDIDKATKELSVIQSLGEARMFRSKEQIAGAGARAITDHIFVNLLSLYAMSQDYNYAPVAKEYAKRTRAPGSSFGRAAPGGTDLYQSIFSALRSDSLLNKEKDAMLMGKVNIDKPRINRFLQQIQQGTVTDAQAMQFFYKLERDLKIQDPKLRASRRLISNWNGLTTQQQQLSGTQLMRYYRLNGRRSDIMPLYSKFTKDNDLILDKGEKRSIAGRIARGAGAFAAGYAIGKALPS